MVFLLTELIEKKILSVSTAIENRPGCGYNPPMAKKAGGNTEKTINPGGGKAGLRERLHEILFEADTPVG